jgi:GGDEF domain-containing protein
MASPIHYVFAVHPHENSVQPQHSLLGKFWLQNGRFSLLEDHGMAPGSDLTQLPPEKVARIIGRMSSSQRRRVVSEDDLKQGFHPDLLPTVDRAREIPSSLQEAMQDQLKERPAGPRVSHYLYHREGMPAPQVLRVAGAKMSLDGHPLGPEEMKQVAANVHGGVAKLRHHVPPTSEGLLKIEPHLMEALGQIRGAVKAGHVHPDALTALSRTLFTDTQCPTMGNLMAYQDFKSRPREGVHIHIDMNGLRALNNDLGHDDGNYAITAHGRALRAAMDEAVGRSKGKLFHVHGDEFIAHVPTHEHAASFARAVRSKLDAIPAIKGTHRLSTSMGWGPTSEHAESALQDAKAAKNSMKYAPGQAKTHAASRMPGAEGAIPVE